MRRCRRDSTFAWPRTRGAIAPSLIVVGGLLAVAVVVLLVWSFSSQRPPDIPPKSRRVTNTASEILTKPPLPPEDYVGSEACAKCHADISHAYQTHPMAHASAAISDASRLEDYEVNTSFSTPGARHYRVVKTGDSVFHHESMTDADDQITFDQGVPIDFEIGSGKRGRSYIINRDGLLFQSPIGWYSGHSRWDLSPGYTGNHHSRFERRIVDGCINCHTGRMAFVRGARDSFQRAPLLEGAISCERCHGPGKQHVARYESPGDFDGKDPIVNPARLDAGKRESVCNQCHLQGVERILRYGRTDFDFRPGQDLSDVWTVFVQGTRIGSDGMTQAVSHVEQMRASQCFQKSEGRFGCTSCHDPHRAPRESERRDFYNAKCLKCHGHGQSQSQTSRECSLPLAERQEQPAPDSCIDCHAPRLPASDVPHTSQTDHRILRRPRMEKGAADSAGALVLFDGAERRLPPLETRRARGLLLVLLAEREKNPFLAGEAQELLLPVLKAAADDVDVIEALGAVAKILGRNDEAKRYWTQVLEQQPRHEMVLRRLAVLCHENGEDDDGVKYLDRLFAINPWQAELHGRQAHMLGRLQRFEAGIRSAERGLELNPTLTQLRSWLADALELFGNHAESRRQREILRRLGAEK